ncbi:hypothetical protein CF326_g5873 [Tilletia indica]|nr:hypothetical protein CF326_g5873 [Tilletia indica]
MSSLEGPLFFPASDECDSDGQTTASESDSDLGSDSSHSSRRSNRHERSSSALQQDQGEAQDTDSDLWGSELLPSGETIKGPLEPLLDLAVYKKQNVLVTGPAGSGKTSLLKMLVKKLKLALRGQENAIYALAPTPAAAQIIEGTTVHAWSGIDFDLANQADRAQSVYKKKGVKKRWRTAKALLFDEISQMDGRIFTLLDAIGRRLRNQCNVPFGGIQIICFGDFYQLPPVGARNAALSPFVFETRAWFETIKHHLRLSGSYRTIDSEYHRMLEQLRGDSFSDEVETYFKSLDRPPILPAGLEPTELFPCDKDADDANDSRLQQLPGPTAFFEALDVVKNVESCQTESVLDRFPVPDRVGFRVNALVTLRKTAIITEQEESTLNAALLCDGQLGRVHGFATLETWKEWSKGVSKSVAKITLARIGHSHGAKVQGEEVPWPIVRFPSSVDGGEVMALVGLETWKWDDSTARSTFAARVQIPLTLGWACTVQQAQNQMMVAVRVNFQRAFECGQVYAALTRVASADRIQVIGFSRSKALADAKVIEYSDPDVISIGTSRPQRWSDGTVTAELERAATPSTGVLLPLYQAPALPPNIPKKRRSGPLADDVKERLMAKVKKGRST